MKIAIIGGGAAGFFAAIYCAEANPACQVTIFERGKDVLEKVRISGGGRCNVTHACPEPRELVKFYPRGSRELLGPFTRFGPVDTIDWFQKRGVRLKTEADGRMFPVTDSSETIVECLTAAARKAGVRIHLSSRVDRFLPTGDGQWSLHFSGETTPQIFQKIMVAAGSSPAVWKILAGLGHRIVEPVPSLFTFKITDPRISGLSGVSLSNVSVRAIDLKLETSGPFLITHWGMSGPGILKMSALGARDFHQKNYRFDIKINWLFNKTNSETVEELSRLKTALNRKLIAANPQFNLPVRLWQRLVSFIGIPDVFRWIDLDKKTIEKLADQLTAAVFQVNGKSTFKEEFVTAGGVDLREINFKNFESRLHPGLHFAGEILDIDALTGGFNFQAAWTGGWLAGLSMSAES